MAIGLAGAGGVAMVVTLMEEEGVLTALVDVTEGVGVGVTEGVGVGVVTGVSATNIITTNKYLKETSCGRHSVSLDRRRNRCFSTHTWAISSCILTFCIILACLDM